MVESTHVSTATTRTRTIWRDVLKICCSDDVIDAYALLKSKEAQNKMLDAFKANVMHLLLDQNRMHHMDQLRGFLHYHSQYIFGTFCREQTGFEILFGIWGFFFCFFFWGFPWDFAPRRTIIIFLELFASR